MDRARMVSEVVGGGAGAEYEALRGETVVGLSDLQGTEHLTERLAGYSHLFEVYIPIFLEGTGTVIGAYEIYRPFGWEKSPPFPLARSRDARILHASQGYSGEVRILTRMTAATSSWMGPSRVGSGSLSGVVVNDAGLRVLTFSDLSKTGKGVQTGLQIRTDEPPLEGSRGVAQESSAPQRQGGRAGSLGR